MTETDVAIIGAGISGLVAAHSLRAAGCGVLVLERQVRPGGNAISERIGGFLMEHGPSSVNMAAAAELNHMVSDLGLNDARVDLCRGVRRRYLTSRGRLNGISVHPLGFLLSRHLSLRGRLRMVAEVLVPGGAPDPEETVAAFGRRRFGAEFADRVLDPLVGGIFAGDASRVTIAAAFPALAGFEREYGSVIRAIVLSRIRGGTMPGRRICSWQNGIGELPRALAALLGQALRTGVAVRRVERTVKGFRLHTTGGTLDAAAVIVATQPHVTAQLVAPLAPAAAAAAAGIAAPPLAVVFLGFPRRRIGHPLDGLGYLTPSGEGRKASGALFCSTMFPGRAPEGHAAIAVYIGGARAPELAQLPAQELIGLARSELADLLGATGAPVVARVRQWPCGLPQYESGHGRAIAALNNANAEAPGLFATGNYLRGVSVGACVGQAMETAKRTVDFLTTRDCQESCARGRLTFRAYP
jgi:oxygen-dependent protoporphyrinogen oxidase